MSSISENHKESGFTHVNNEGTLLTQLKHEFINVGDTIARVKYSTSARVTEMGTIIVCQFKQEISSRANEVYFFSNDTAFFEGIVSEAKQAFEGVDFDKLNSIKAISKQVIITPLVWENNSRYDSQEHGGKPITWGKWGGDTETTLEHLKTNQKEEKFFKCLENVVLLASGKYKKPKKSRLSILLNKIFK